MKELTIVFFTFLLLNCNNGSKSQSKGVTKISVNQDSSKVVSSIGEVLSTDAQKVVANWKEYHTFDSLVSQYYNISTNNALVKAKGLSSSAQQLKDSIRIERFNQPDLKIRLNVLYNSTLRLYDMESIPKLDTQEIKKEVKNTVKAFSSVNSKINNIVNKNKLESEIDLKK